MNIKKSIMNCRLLTLALIAAIVIGSPAQLRAQTESQNVHPDGGIDAALLAKLRDSYKGDATDKALKNALSGTSISKLAVNSENAAMMDTHFSDRVRTKGITDQKSSGRCWLFTGLNVLRAKMIDKYDLPSFEFSQNYIFFYDQLEKCNLFLQGIIDTRGLSDDDRKVDWLFSNPLSDGG